MRGVFWLIIFLLCGSHAFSQTFTAEEKAVILSGDTTSMLRVIQITEQKELKILTTVSGDITPGDPLISLLAARMLKSVNDPLNPGVGIAAPQVGINKNVIWVQRYDKPGQPFEFYLNPKITWRSALLIKGPEGCLSVPEVAGNVLRSYAIRLSYHDKAGTSHEELIEGFTAVIFQHETDHLRGILFTSRLSEQAAGVYNEIGGQVGFYLPKP
ncbi:peptide deformylase [Emticicia sp. CRIBPO]|uniref:peptide deformylase n=1 Tax=Emticicia sp. CRIBPO TaxID=2683258 RepID=UPI0014131336|nr:peptide deformylase [Emticicia sp. CRIBPO]NBA87533.1 peptide deformylase [Emticicia sp. CRIBPO]